MSLDKRFLRQVQDLLQHFYDYPYLHDHPLVEKLLPERDKTSRERVRALRSTVSDAITELKPKSRASFRSEAARSYNVLNLRYIEGWSVAEVAGELALSERQLHRYLRKAELDLAAILWTRHLQQIESSGLPDEGTHPSLVLREAQRLNREPQSVAPEALLDGVVSSVRRLGEQLQVQLDVNVPPDMPSTLDTDRVLAKQALVNTLSSALQEARPGSAVSLSAQPYDGGIMVEVSYQARQPKEVGDAVPVAAQQLIKSLGGEWSVRAVARGMLTITIFLRGAQETLVLVIDDNEGLVELFRRYLTGEGYAVLGACDGNEGLRLAQEQTPDIIVLDVMMPGNDGYEVLQWLQTRSVTRDIPVIICSVLDDPQLAYSLGAKGFLAKPVKPGQLLSVLSQCRTHNRAQLRPAEPEDIWPSRRDSEQGVAQG